MFIGNQDALVEFARLAREYPAEPVENLWEQAGGTTTRAADEGDSADEEEFTNPYLLSAAEIERTPALRG